MKKSILKPILALFMLSVSLTSCDRDDYTPAPVVEPAIFEYAEGGEPSMSTVTNPFANASTQTIFGNNGSTNVVEIKLNTLVVGVYEIGSLNTFKYTRPGQTGVWTAISGRITILEVNGNKISGTFNLTAGDSDLGINSVSGSFKRVTVNP